MNKMNYGRKFFSLADGAAVHTGTSITEKALPREDEDAFTQRLLKHYGHCQGTVEIIFKDGRPNYAVITFSEECM
jgi:hypothetical protein